MSKISSVKKAVLSESGPVDANQLRRQAENAARQRHEGGNSDEEMMEGQQIAAAAATGEKHLTAT